MQFSEATLARFAREVAKYPAEQKQSAVMACLAIVQQEQGWRHALLDVRVASSAQRKLSRSRENRSRSVDSDSFTRQAHATHLRIRSSPARA